MSRAVPLPDSSESSIPSWALDALSADATLPICTACGTQYSGPQEGDCVICADPRQYVPEQGQTWTTLAELADGHVNELLPDREDPRIVFLDTKPAFGIGQKPTLIQTPQGSYIWDCAAYISPALVAYLLNLEQPLKGIIISHPHFFTTSLTWARALRVPLYLSSADKTWYQRGSDVTDEVVWWDDEIKLSTELRGVICGGHFPGSAVLHFDRSQADHGPILFCADTVMVQPTQRGFTFPWSVPNLIPLSPRAILHIRDRLRPFEFDQATSSWPGRWIRRDAKAVLEGSLEDQMRAMGWAIEGDHLVPL